MKFLTLLRLLPNDSLVLFRFCGNWRSTRSSVASPVAWMNSSPRTTRLPANSPGVRAIREPVTTISSISVCGTTGASSSSVCGVTAASSTSVCGTSASSSSVCGTTGAASSSVCGTAASSVSVSCAPASAAVPINTAVRNQRHSEIRLLLTPFFTPFSPLMTIVVCLDMITLHVFIRIRVGRTPACLAGTIPR